MRQRFWCGLSGVAAVGLFMANTLWGGVFAGEQRGVTLHQRAGGTDRNLSDATQPPACRRQSPARRSH